MCRNAEEQAACLETLMQREQRVQTEYISISEWWDLYPQGYRDQKESKDLQDWVMCTWKGTSRFLLFAVAGPRTWISCSWFIWMSLCTGTSSLYAHLSKLRCEYAYSIRQGLRVLSVHWALHAGRDYTTICLVRRTSEGWYLNLRCCCSSCWLLQALKNYIFVTGNSVASLMDKPGQKLRIQWGEAFKGQIEAEEPMLQVDSYSSLRSTDQAHNSWWGKLCWCHGNKDVV